MSLYSIYFSPTGGTKSVMNLLTTSWNEEPITIDLTQRHTDFTNYSLNEHDICFIGVPSFGGRVPAVALQQLSLLNGHGARAVLVTTFGNRAYEDTLLELQDTAVSCGFKVCGAVSAVTEHSIMHQYGTARPDQQDQEELVGFSEQLFKTISSIKDAPVLSLPGNRPFRTYNGIPLKPKTSKSCTKCGACFKLCPVGAISSDNPSQINTQQCISCMRCIKLCPAKARRLNPLMLFVAKQKLKKACATRKTNELFLPSFC